MFRVGIPARYGSTRLPGKPLVLLAGLPLVLHVHRRALRSGAAEVVVATDDERIREVCAEAGAGVEMTSDRHPSGTDRLAELAERRSWHEDDIVVNVQGDVLLPPALIDQVAALLEADPHADIATLAVPLRSGDEYRNPHIVKVVTRGDRRALYFSRAPIPAHGWDAGGVEAVVVAQRHVGVYAYRVGALRRLARLAPSPLEMCERLEQLRALENGMTIVVGVAAVEPGPHVDTPEDRDRVEKLLAAGALP